MAVSFASRPSSSKSSSKFRSPHVGKAVHRFARIAPRKVRPLADLIRGRDVDDALVQLQFAKQRAAMFLRQVIKTAVANFNNLHPEFRGSIFVASAFVDEGPVIKRFQPKERGKAYPINKRTSHISVSVEPYPDEYQTKHGKKLRRKLNAQDVVSLERIGPHELTSDIQSDRTSPSLLSRNKAHIPNESKEQVAQNLQTAEEGFDQSKDSVKNALTPGKGGVEVLKLPGNRLNMPSFAEWSITRRDHSNATWSLANCTVSENDSTVPISRDEIDKQHDIRLNFIHPSTPSDAVLFLDSYRTKNATERMLSLVWGAKDAKFPDAWASATKFFVAVASSSSGFTDSELKWVLNSPLGVEEGTLHSNEIISYENEIEWATKVFPNKKPITAVLVSLDEAKVEVDLTSSFGSEKQAVLFWPASKVFPVEAASELIARTGPNIRNVISLDDISRFIREAIALANTPDRT